MNLKSAVFIFVHVLEPSFMSPEDWLSVVSTVHNTGTPRSCLLYSISEPVDVFLS